MPAANWYLDPQDPTLLRWWDGARWTTHVIAAPAQRKLSRSALTVIVLLGSILVLAASVVVLIMFMSWVVG